MYFSFSIVTPANTAKTEKKETVMSLRVGVIRHVRIRIPPGQRGLAHVHVNHMLKQLYPLNTGEDIHGDGEAVDFEDFYELHQKFTELKAYTWNEDTRYSRETIVSFTVLPKWFVLPQLIGQSIRKGFETLIGKSKEV